MESDNHVNVVNSCRRRRHQGVIPTFLAKKELKKILRQEQSHGNTSSRRRRRSWKHDDPFSTVYYYEIINTTTKHDGDAESKNKICLSDGQICLLVKKKTTKRRGQHNEDKDICCCRRLEECDDYDDEVLSSVPVIFKTFPSRRRSRTPSKNNQRCDQDDKEEEQVISEQNEGRKQTTTRSQTSVDQVDVDVGGVPRLLIPPCIASSLGISSIELYGNSNGGAVSEKDGIYFDLCPISSYKSIRDVPHAKVASLQKICTTTTLDNDAFMDQKDDEQFVQDIQHYFGTATAPHGRLVNSNSSVGIPSSSGDSITYFKIRFDRTTKVSSNKDEHKHYQVDNKNNEPSSIINGTSTTNADAAPDANIYIVSSETRLTVDSSTNINLGPSSTSIKMNETIPLSPVVLPHFNQVLQYYHYTSALVHQNSSHHAWKTNPSTYSLFLEKKHHHNVKGRSASTQKTFTRELAERFVSCIRLKQQWYYKQIQQNKSSARSSRNAVMMVQSSSSHFSSNNNAHQDIKERISEAAWAVGMTCLHIDGLAAFSYRYRKRQSSQTSFQMSGGGILDQINGLKAAFELAAASSSQVPCVIHISNLEEEFTSAEQSLDPDALEDKERRFVTTVLECLETCRQPVIVLLSTNRSSFPYNSPIMKKLISSGTNNIFTLGPPTRQEAERIWKQHPGRSKRGRNTKKKTKTRTKKTANEEDIDTQSKQHNIDTENNIDFENKNNGNDIEDDCNNLLLLEKFVMEQVLDTFRAATELKCLRDEYFSTAEHCLPRDWQQQNETAKTREVDLNEKAKTVVGQLRHRLSNRRDSTSCLMNVDSSNTTNTNIPKVYWEDVGGLAHVRQEIMDIVELPIQCPHLFAGPSSSSSKGILLYGPPGSGKTLVAKAIATECHIPFLSIKGPELLGSYVGESEANIRRVFKEARQAARAHHVASGGTTTSHVAVCHAVLFFDELDSLAPKRGKDSDGGGIMDRVSSTLLGELDGSSGAEDDDDSATSTTVLFVIGATNRPDLLDTALLRPGRFDRHVYLGLSSAKQDKIQILSAQMRHFVFEEDQSAKEMATSVVDDLPFGLSGADLSAVSSGAMKCCLRRICRDIEDEVLKRQHQQQESTTTSSSGTNTQNESSSLYAIRREVMKELNLCDKLEPRVSKQDILEAAQRVKPSVSTQDLAKYEALRNLFS